MWEKFKGIIIIVGVGAGVGAISSFLNIDFTSGNSGSFDIISIVTNLILGFLWFQVGVIFHEFGHLIMGKATGYKFLSFQVGPFLWSREMDGKINFRIWNNSYDVAGQCLMIPTENEADFKYFWYNFGGVLFNLFLIAGSFFFMQFPTSEFLYLFFRAGLGVNAFMFISNLTPLPWLQNDGRNIYSASRSKDAKLGFQKWLLQMGAFKQGKRYRDLSDNFFSVSETADSNNSFVGYQILMEYRRLEDTGNREAALKELRRLNLDTISSSIKGEVKCEWLYHYLIHEPNLDKARELYKDKHVKELFAYKMAHLTRLQAAYTYVVEENHTKAFSLFENAQKQVEKLPYKGWQKMEREALEALGKRMGVQSNNEESPCKAIKSFG